MIYDLTVNNFKDVIDYNEFVLIEFYSKTCLPCKASLSILEEVKKFYKEITFCKVNRESENILSEGFNVKNVPCLFLIEKGRIVHKEIGLLSKDKLINLIDSILYNK